MKTIRPVLILLVLFSIVLSGCNKQKEPNVSLLNDRFITTNVDISPGGLLLFKWMAEKGKSDLESFTVRVNGDDHYGFPNTSIEPDIHYDSIFMEGPTSTGDFTFSFIATDVDGNFGEKAIVVTVQ